MVNSKDLVTQPERMKQRVGVILLLMGLGLLVASVLIVIHRGTQSPEVLPVGSGDVQAATTQLRLLLVALVFLLVILALALLGVVVTLGWGRRFRESMRMGPRRPTATDDVWRMHHLADDESATGQND